MKVFVYVWFKTKTQTGEPPLVNARIPNEQKMCEKSHCGKSFLCIFTLLRGDEQHKRRMEMRMKRVRHERHILLGFVKRGRKQRLLLFFLFFFFFTRVVLFFSGSCKKLLGSICGRVPPQLFSSVPSYHFPKQLLRL